MRGLVEDWSIGIRFCAKGKQCSSAESRVSKLPRDTCPGGPADGAYGTVRRCEECGSVVAAIPAGPRAIVASDDGSPHEA